MALAACSNAPTKTAAPSATLATEPPRTTTTDPYAVPSVIDAAYVNRVLAGLDAAKGDITRMILTARTIPAEAIERLKTLYSDKTFLQLSIDGYQDDVAKNFSTYKPNPGNKVSTVREIISAKPACVFARVSRDYTAVSARVLAVTDEWVALQPKLISDPLHYNPTPWSFLYDGFDSGGQAPKDPCAGF